MNDDYSLAMNIKEDIEECITRRDNSFPCISSFLLKPSVRKILGELSGENYIIHDSRLTTHDSSNSLEYGHKETILDRVLSMLRNIEIDDFRLINILEILKDVRIDLSETDLSCLDLRRISLNNVRLGYGEIDGILKSADLRGSIMSPSTMFPEGYEGHGGEVFCLALSPDGKTLMSLSSDKTIKEWDISTGYCRKTFNTDSHVRFACYTQDGKGIVTVNRYGIIKIWNGRGEIVKSHTAKCGEVYSAHVSPDGEKIVLGSNVITEINLYTGEVIKIYRGHSYKVNSVQYSKDGMKILSGGSYGEMKEWDVSSGGFIRNFEKKTEEITSVSYSPDGKMIACGSKDGIIQEYDSETGVSLKTCRSSGYHIITLSYSRDGSKIAAVSKNKIIEEWDMESGTLLKIFQGHLWDVNAILYGYDGTRIFSASSDRTVKEWNADTGDCVKTYEKIIWNINFFTLSPDGSRLVFCGGDNTLKEWDSFTGRCVRIYTGHSMPVIEMCYTSDGTRIASCSEDGTIKEWNVLTGACVGTYERHKVTCLCYSKDGKKLLSGSGDCTVKELDIETGEYVKHFECHEKGLRLVSYRGDTVIAMSGDKVILWDFFTGEILKIHDFSFADSLSYSGAVIITKKKMIDYEDYIEIKEWDPQTGECLRRNSDYLVKDERIINHNDWHVLDTDHGTVKKWDNGKYSLEIRNIPGLFIQCVNMAGIKIGEEDMVVLNQYGAITD